MRPFHLGAIILAAGASSRMGQPKMLLPWGNTTVVGHLVDLWRQLGAKQVAVVCAAGDAALATELDRVGLPATDRISNPQPERGMFSSIRCAAAWEGWHADLTHWVVVLGDQPHLRLESLRPLIDFAAVHPESVCQPSWNGHGRHPVL
jgi:molybdenum cofactor cytidylyltransferase